MLSCRVNKVMAAALMLLFTALYLSASSKKVWSTNVAKLGYEGDRKRTIVRWRGHYVVIGSSRFIRDDKDRKCVLAFDPNQPLLVFDVVARKQAPREVLGDYAQEWEPPRAHKNFYPCQDKDRYRPLAEIISPELSYGSDYDKRQFVVYSNGKEKYRISPDEFGCWDICVVSNRTGSRFAILEKGQSWGTKIATALQPWLDDYPTDKKVIRVFAAQSGKKLFELAWAEPQPCPAPSFDDSERVAFSDDGEMLAVLGDHGELRVFRILDDR
jgi:hypothetical protein